MPGRLYDFFPDSEALLSLEPEELAGIVLEFLNSFGPTYDGQLLNRHNFSLPNTVDGYPREKWEEILRALMESWVWLEREGLLAPKPGSFNEGWVFITRRGKQVLTREDFQSYYHGNILPKHLLHPVIAQKVWGPFIRGEYDTAVFQAFKEVEVRVRENGGFSQTDLGERLMRKAFDVNEGPLTDLNLPESERIALQHLFASAIGLYKNPHSHRNLPLTPTEAVEMIMLASHLLNIADIRHGAAIARNLLNDS
jgi:uncharacterized protein (TIGR02391 family)